ncbi:MAG: Methyltransferase type 11 [Parcubacteria group bacterium GW2011_GWC2_45_7]|nr:MAG: Methyltransferase type 11 [Parcubacteria group bacterium GW2011_GWC2_45_7]KKU74103.1 MAG: Methyltransferase type 11 [Parcubacteria group bacterium GW2011_GWA2_47_26]
MTKILAEEIHFDLSSYVDPYGRVFLWNGRIFRGISLDSVEHVKRLMENATIKRLQEQGKVIDTQIPQETADGFGFLIEHRRVQYPSYCIEWTPQMLKDAALLTLNICLEISDENLTLQDAYPWNIFFEGTKPVFIDFGSFVPARSDVLWAPYEQFCNFFLFPLYLYSVGLFDAARRFLFEYLGGLPAEQFFRLAPFSLKTRYPFHYAKHASNFHLANVIRRLKLEEKMRGFIKKSYQRKSANVARGRKTFFKALIKEVEAIKISSERSHWRAYYEDKKEMCSYGEREFVQKEKTVYDVLHRYKPSSVFDAGCNTGVYALLAASVGARVIAVDTDEPSVSKLYSDAKQRSADILPLVLDVLNPSPRFGWLAKQFPSASERFQADMVFAFALIHHLAITSRQGFARVLDVLDAFSNGHVLLEWVSPEDPKVKKLIANSHRDHSGYSFDELKLLLDSRYKDVVYYPPHTPTRQFILYAR